MNVRDVTVASLKQDRSKLHSTPLVALPKGPSALSEWHVNGISNDIATQQCGRVATGSPIPRYIVWARSAVPLLSAYVRETVVASCHFLAASIHDVRVTA
jgi:hypothetical protein